MVKTMVLLNIPCQKVSLWFTSICVCYLVKFVAEKLGIPSPPPYLSLLPNDDKLLKGVNYASGGAGILNDTGLYFVRISFTFFLASTSE